MKIGGWLLYALVQLWMLAFWLLGLLVLIVPCWRQSWQPSKRLSIKDGQRVIDEWKSPVMHWLGMHNPEDGDSGQHALIWRNGVQVPFMPNADPRWRAYCWSALRNSADGWKYWFAWEGGPFATFTVFGHTIKLGWQNGLPVLS